MEHEEWRPVARDPRYEVSNLGRVRSWVRLGPSGHGLRDVPLVLAASGRSDYRYPTVWGPPRNPVKVHELVAEAFLGPRPEGMLIRHLDDNPLNNRASNLAWGTQADNIADAERLNPGRTARHMARMRMAKVARRANAAA
jgi:hypothetical protein